MEKINIAELLKDCPGGMELDCTMYNKVTLVNVDNKEDNPYPIKIKLETGCCIILTKYGQYTDADFAKCVIFPKGKTTWEGFQRPFKDGDILATDLGSVFYLNTRLNTDECYGCYVGIGGDGSFHICGPFAYKECCGFATEEEKEKLFKAIKDNGYSWNPETKNLEKLIQPNFKVGDEIKYKYPTTDTSTLTIIKVEYDKNRYVVCDKPNNFAFLSFFAQDNFNLIRKTKFDTSTLVPFDSRVLVRDHGQEKWIPAIWGFYDNNSVMNYHYKCIGGAFTQCIPYEGNEHLLGTTDDCNEYYKIWK